jgi:transcriptional regulator with XRE-family HTH domain
MLSKRLKNARNNKKLTQEELAIKVNTTKGTISNYENGHSTPPNEMLKLLADVLNTTSDYLLGRIDNPDQPDEFNKLINNEHNIAYFGGAKKELTEEEAQHLEESLEMFRALKAKRNAEKNK